MLRYLPAFGTSFLISFVCTLVTCCAAQDGNQNNIWSEEPPLIFRVTIGNETIEVANERPSTIRIDGRERKINVTTAPYRTFNRIGVRFDYPAHFRYRWKEPTPGERAHYCIIEGEDIKVYIKEHFPKLDFPAFANHVRDKHKDMPLNVVVEERTTSLSGADASFRGITFEFAGNIAGNEFRQVDRCFLLPSKDTDSSVILVISTYGEELTRDAAYCITVLEKSLTIEATP